MDLDAYVDARHTLLVRTAVLLGCAPERSRPLVVRVLAEEAAAIRRREDPDPDVLAALHRAVLADRVAHPDEPVLLPRPDRHDRSPHDQSPHDQGLEVRRRLATLPADVRDLAVLGYGTALSGRDLAEALGVRARELPARAAAARSALGAADTDDAHHRLGMAGETVLVEPPGPLPSVSAPGRDRRRPVLLLLVLLALAAVVSLALPDDPPPRRRVAPAPEPPSRTLRGDQLPSLLGYRLPEALERLHDLSLIGGVDRVDVCEPPDVVLGTSPGAGATFRLGSSVDVITARRDVRPCAVYRGRVAAWAFLGFASGREPAPAFARQVRVVADGGAPVTLSRLQARSPRRWGAALASVAHAVGRIGVDSYTYVTPGLTVRRTVPAASACGLARPAGLERRTALELSLTLPTESGGCPLTVDLYRAGGLVDAVVVRGPRPQGTDTDGAVS